ncbi:MAG: nucleoid-associated protein [Lachnospiraceae bacterium]|nr:nucleoid-associated protein [Lachnospiraceae bacterium]
MTKGDIIIRNAIVHILDSTVGMPVLSDSELSYGSDFADFLKEHIYKVLVSDDKKNCEFIEEESEVFRLISNTNEGKMDFVNFSKDIATKLYDIMNSNIEIPAADLMVVYFEVNQIAQLALLKMNYRASYMHTTISDEGVNTNSVTKYKAMLPSETSRLTEAAVINLTDYKIKLIEKKYSVNGVKENYFSKLFLNCTSNLSQKAKLNIVERAIETVQKEYFNDSEQFEEKMRAKSVIHEELTNQGSITVEEVADKVFEEKPELKDKFKEKVKKYKIDEEEEIIPQNETTTRKFEKQHLTTDTGIEIKIPMEQYNSTDNIEFLTNEDGTISVLIKNIGHITSK